MVVDYEPANDQVEKILTFSYAYLEDVWAFSELTICWVTIDLP